MQNGFGYTEQNRLMAKALNLYYMENMSQIEISKRLGLSTVKINRMIKFARQAGMVEINLKLPFPSLFDLESRLIALSSLQDVIVTPSLDNSPDGDLSQLAQAAANFLLRHIRPQDSICIGGGRTVSKIVNYVEQHKISGVRVYPALGGVQNLNDRDLNTVAVALAQKLGGEAIKFYAPAFAETEEECATFFGLKHVINFLEQARTARMGLFGMGSLQIDSSVIQYCSLPYQVLAELVRQRNGVGEILGYAIDPQGRDCIPELSKLVVGISLDDFRSIPVRIGAAGGEEKAPAIAAAIRGKYFTTLFIDENAARSVIKILEAEPAPPTFATQTNRSRGDD